jgi:single-stranded-DNA-specific exonuclease
MLIKPRQRNEKIQALALAAGLSPLQSHILAGRLVDVGTIDGIAKIIQPALRHVDNPKLFKDGDRAASRIARAVMEGERIGIVTDYDVDGVTSHALIYRALTEYFRVPPVLISRLIGHRIEDGYGVSEKLTNRLLAQQPLPALIITADCGSSDEARIARLKHHGIDVIVTDHHALPIEGPPPSAHAVINPARSDCAYPDTTIAGCMTAWLLMSHVRGHLLQAGYLDAAAPKLARELDYVALGTVADCVSIGTPINRAVVNAGLRLMNEFTRPCWRAMQRLLKRNGQPFSAADLAFQIGPRINARSRMADPYAALHYLLADDDQDALHYLGLLDLDNQDRKVVERDMVEAAKRQAGKLVERGSTALVVYLREGHAGVQGIVASRLVDAFGRPAIVLCDAHEPAQLSGSARGIPGLDMRAALQQVVGARPNLLSKFGGHRHAAGLAIDRLGLAAFQDVFEQAVREQLGERTLAPVIWTDGGLPAEALSLDTWAELEQLQPYGREFETPAFENGFHVEAMRAVGAEPIHLSLRLRREEQIFEAIWFRALPAPDAPLPCAVGARLYCVYQLARNEYRGMHSLRLVIQHAITDSSPHRHTPA